MNLAERLQELRKEESYSQEQLADIIGVSRQAVSKWESGKAVPDIYNIQKLSQIYQITTDYIICGKKTEVEKLQEPQIIYQEKVVYQEKGTFQKLVGLPLVFKIALAISGTVVMVLVVAPALLMLVCEIFSLFE